MSDEDPLGSLVNVRDTHEDMLIPPPKHIVIFVMFHQMFYFVINGFEIIMVLGHIVCETMDLLWLWL